MDKKKYTWEQIEEALSVAGVDSSRVRRALSEAVDYSGRATQGVDPEGQETYEPRAPAEKAWADMHKVQVFDRPDAERQDGTEEVGDPNMPVAPTSAPKPEVNVSFDRIKRMMSQ